MITDLRYALRSLRRWPLGSSMAIVTLTIAIGAATSLYTFLHAVLSIQAPHIPDLDRLARIYVATSSSSGERNAVAMTDFASGLSKIAAFESIAAFQSSDARITIGSQHARIDVARITDAFFDVVRAQPASGRLIAADEAQGGAPVMVVSSEMWRQHFEGGVPGRAAVVMNGTSWTVVGVLPPGFGSALLGIDADAYVPMRASAALPATASVMGRLKGDRSWSAARAELDALAAHGFADRHSQWRLIPVSEDLRARVTNASAFVLGPAVIVLLIGCINVSCMLLARGIERRDELAVRGALGAGRMRIVRQLVTEQLVIAGIAGVLGCGLAIVIVRILSSQMKVLPSAPQLAPDASILAIALAISVAAAVIFGAWPAVRDSRREVTIGPHGAASAPSRIAGYHARDLVVFTELALAVVLVVVAALWLKLFAEMERITPAFAADRLIAVRIAQADLGAASTAIASLPGIGEIAAASRLPGRRSPAVALRASSGRLARGSSIAVQPSFFSALDLPIRRGRNFAAAETAASSSIVVSESIARALWPNGDPIGATVRIESGRGGTTRVVIGVCDDALALGTLAGVGVISPDFYVPLDLQSVQEPVLIARIAGDAHGVVKAIDAALSAPAFDSSRAVVVADEMRFVPEQSVFMIRMLAGFGIIALLLAASGVFGVVSQSVSQRTGEFGVRMAVGASPASVMLMVIGHEAKLIAAALLSGALLTVFVTRVVFAELVLVAGVDPLVWLGLTVLCGGAAAAAVAIATRRIVRLDPASVLRHA